MSTTSPAEFAPTIERCRPADVTPVTLEATALESTAPDHLRALNREFAQAGLSPVELTVTAQFDEDCSLATRKEIERIRRYVRAGAFLGVSTVSVTIERVATPEKVRPELTACAERAERDGVVLELDGPMTLEH
ncbi:hypothetical protein [Natrarchaeobaculum sulfurireducens]|nr:hypothetical protein [Natrarchaeobaculum sulfurireducens]